MANINGTAASDGIPGNGIPLVGDTNLALPNDVMNFNWSLGDDWMFGGIGNDIYNVNSAGDKVFEGAGNGTDTVVSRVVAYTLGDNVEHLTLDNAVLTAFFGTGNGLGNVMIGNNNNNTLSGLDGNDTLSGGNGNDFLFGGNGIDTLNGDAGIDFLDGGTGFDKMSGGLNNDTYVVDNILDQTLEAAGGGTDLVLRSVNSFGALASEVENLTLTGVATLGIGNGLANVINGNASNNTLQGQAGSDTLLGNGGDDTLDGGTENDTLTGGTGSDHFVFANRGNTDTITDFSDVGQDDDIVLSNALDTGLFLPLNPGIKGLTFVGGNVVGNDLDAGSFFKGAGFNGNGFGAPSGIYVNTSNGNIFYNPDTAAGSFQIGDVAAAAAAAATFTSADFEYGL